MQKLRENYRYLMTKKCERVQITIDNLDLYIIRNDQGIILDVYANSPKAVKTGEDFVNTFTVWFEDDIYRNEE